MYSSENKSCGIPRATVSCSYQLFSMFSMQNTYANISQFATYPPSILGEMYSRKKFSDMS